MSTEHPPTVVVVDSVPTFKLGLETALVAADINVASPTDVRAWCRTVGVGAVSISLRSPEDEQLLNDLFNSLPELVLVAVLVTVDDAAFRSAIVNGAHAAVAWNDRSEEIVDVIRSALRGKSLMPTGVVRSLAVEANQRNGISTEERGWLAQLAKGVKVAQLARDSGYSEREMHRLLRRLYHRMDAESRSEALVTATRLGLVP